MTIDELQDRARCEKLYSIIKSFNGDSRILSRAIGFYYMGLFFGWRYLYLVHGKKTVKKYEQVLNIKVTEEFTPISTESHRSLALTEVLDKRLNYWKVVSSDIPITSERAYILSP